MENLSASREGLKQQASPWDEEAVNAAAEAGSCRMGVSHLSSRGVVARSPTLVYACYFSDAISSNVDTDPPLC